MAALSAHAVIEVGPKLDIAKLGTHRIAAGDTVAVPWWNMGDREADGHMKPLDDHAGRVPG